jgi:hypothetical protein
MIEKIGQGLKYPPLKTKVNKKLPEYLFWEHKDRFDTWDISMFSTKDPKKTGKMSLIKTTQPVNGRPTPYILVLMLLSKPRKQGACTKMLDYVQKFSKRNNCDGRFYLCADAQFTPKEAPHIFYRKYGMNTGVPVDDKKIDMFIKNGKNGTIQDFPHQKMYYPPIPPSEKPAPKQKSLWQLLKGLFQE